MVEVFHGQGDPTWGVREPIGKTAAIDEAGHPQEIEFPYSATILFRVLRGPFSNAYEYVRQLPDFSELYIVAGDYDMLARVQAGSYNELREVIGRTFKSIWQMEGLYATTLIPLDQ